MVMGGTMSFNFFQALDLYICANLKHKCTLIISMATYKSLIR